MVSCYSEEDEHISMNYTLSSIVNSVFDIFNSMSYCSIHYVLDKRNKYSISSERFNPS